METHTVKSRYCPHDTPPSHPRRPAQIGHWRSGSSVHAPAVFITLSLHKVSSELVCFSGNFVQQVQLLKDRYDESVGQKNDLMEESQMLQVGAT